MTCQVFEMVVGVDLDGTRVDAIINATTVTPLAAVFATVLPTRNLATYVTLQKTCQSFQFLVTLVSLST